LPFYLPLTPRKRQRCLNGSIVPFDTGSKSLEFGRRTLASPGEPRSQSACLSLLDHLHKVLSQLIEFLQISIGLADALNERPLVCRELLLVFDEQPGRVPG
jgi:hypothetical protein